MIVRTALFTVVILLTAAAWFLTWSNAHNMGLLMQFGVPMSLGMEGSAGLASFFLFTGMWLVMMLAMMLPSTYPTLQLFRTVYNKRQTFRGGTFLFALSYFLVWTAAGSLFYLAYIGVGWFRQATAPTSGSMVLRAAGLALVVSGLYQCSRLKRACLRHCKSPLHFVMEHWHDGSIGAIRMGATHGIYCCGCCWGLMVILFVMGVMHLGWMAAIGALILLEKLVPSGKWISNAIGAVFIVIGLVVMLFPDVLVRLSSQVVL